MKYLLLSLITALFIGCIQQNESLCENVSCIPWEFCNYKTGKCEVSKGYCSNYYDCVGKFAQCNETTHICEEISCNSDIECNIKSYGNYCKHQKCYETLYCSISDDCTIMNYDSTEFGCNSGYCIPFQQVKFNEEFEYDQSSGFSKSYYFVLHSKNSMYDFDLEISGLNNLTRAYANVNIYENSQQMYDSYSVYGCYKNNNLKENLTCEINGFYLQETIFMVIDIEYRSCDSDCENIKPVIKFSQNNPNGCETNDDCQSTSNNLTIPKSICDTENHICKANAQENISNLGERCDLDVNCIDHSTGDVKCNGTCYQVNCSSVQNVCKSLFDETAQYCDRNFITYDYSYCRNYCYASNDGNCLANETCNESTNKCQYYY